VQQNEKNDRDNNNHRGKIVFITARKVYRFGKRPVCECEKDIAEDKGCKYDRPYFLNAISLVHKEIIQDQNASCDDETLHYAYQ